jgi:hypothetical protein
MRRTGWPWPPARRYDRRMASLIESLVGAPLVRQDNVRLEVVVRPPPTRLRDLADVLGALGVAATFAGLRRSLDLRKADARLLGHAILGRWLTNEEIAAIDPQAPVWNVMRTLLVSEEFRTPFLRRVLQAFPEQRRLLHVRIPSCAGQFIDALFAQFCCSVPLDTGSRTYANPERFASMMGPLFRRIDTGSGFAVSLPTMRPFIEPPSPATSGTAEDPLFWTLDASPLRGTDLLFAVIRPPGALALSQVNGTLTLLRRQPDHPALRPVMRKIGAPPPGADAAAWKALARRLLAEALPANPICHALGDGSAAGALAACRRVPVELVDLEQLRDWARPAIGPVALEPVAVSEPFLTQGGLTREDHGIIAARMAEDLVFYERFAFRLKESGLPMVRGGADL